MSKVSSPLEILVEYANESGGNFGQQRVALLHVFHDVGGIGNVDILVVSSGKLPKAIDHSGYFQRPGNERPLRFSTGNKAHRLSVLLTRRCVYGVSRRRCPRFRDA